ncbi:MAG: hypothetical protein HYX80_06050 [Chloroflexi bacterium]|nr:hypothetical protein [Chloroflexota bacterium]
MMSWDGEKETEADTEFSEVFCCRGCLWAFEFESHQIWGMTEQEIRTHLIEEHGMAYPTGAPAGNMSSECRRKFEAVAQAIDRFLGLE